MLCSATAAVSSAALHHARDNGGAAPQRFRQPRAVDASHMLEHVRRSIEGRVHGSTYCLDTMQRSPGGGRAFSLVPTNDQLVRIKLASKVQQRLAFLGWPTPFVAATTQRACNQTAVPCLFTNRCGFLDTRGRAGFAGALCAKVLAAATLFELGADVFVTDSDVAFFGGPPWDSPAFQDASIVGQGDAVPLNTGMLYLRHVRPSADVIVKWTLAEWLHRIQTVAMSVGCYGCDQALLNELVNSMVLCEESGWMMLGFLLNPKVVEAVLPKPARAEAHKAFEESFGNYSQLLRRAGRLYSGDVAKTERHLVTTIPLNVCSVQRRPEQGVATLLPRYFPAAHEAYTDLHRVLPLPTNLAGARQAFLKVASSSLFMHWGEYEKLHWRSGHHISRYERLRGNHPAASERSDSMQEAGFVDASCQPIALHLSGYTCHPIRPLVLHVLAAPPTPPTAHRVLLLSHEWPQVFLETQSVFETFVYRLAWAAVRTGFKLAVPVVPPTASWAGVKRRWQSLVPAGCGQRTWQRWMPNDLAYECKGRLLAAFREGDGWRLDTPGASQMEPSVILAAEQHRDWEAQLLRSARAANKVLLVRAAFPSPLPLTFLINKTADFISCRAGALPELDVASLEDGSVR